VCVSISSLVPNADDLLSLEVEEVAWILLAHLKSLGNNSGDGVVSQGRVSPYNFFNFLGQHPEYAGRQGEVNEALQEAWSWLEHEGFLVQDPSQPSSPWFFFSRRGRKLQSREAFEAYRRAGLLPRAQLHPLIAATVYPTFLRGEYDTAVFQAFREVEVAIRREGNFPAELVGVSLMREAFRPVDPRNSAVAPGPMTDTTLPIAEQEGMAHLFAGAIASFKNPTSHRIMRPEPTEAAEVIVFASFLLRMVDRLSSGAKAFLKRIGKRVD
jgi:uncharacterized protein (TIGR02391 family)